MKELAEIDGVKPGFGVGPVERLVRFGEKVEFQEQGSVEELLPELQEHGNEKLTIVGPQGEQIEVPERGLVLGVEKFRGSGKHYRLIWIYGGEAWLCHEDETEYRRVYGPNGIIAAGERLVKGQNEAVVRRSGLSEDEAKLERIGVRFDEGVR